MDSSYAKRYWKMFKWSLGVGASLILITTVILVSNTHSPLCYTVKCINNLYFNVLKVPVALLSAFIPLWGILLLLHRTAQTEKQIEYSERHNLANNYFMHKKEFSEVCRAIETQFGVHLDTFKAYKTLFPMNTPHNVKFGYSDDHFSLLSKVFPKSFLPCIKEHTIEPLKFGAPHSSKKSMYYRLRLIQYVLSKLGCSQKQIGFTINHTTPQDEGIRTNATHNHDNLTFPQATVRDSAALTIRLVNDLLSFADVDFDTSKLKNYFYAEFESYSDEVLLEHPVFTQVTGRRLEKLPVLNGWHKDIKLSTVEDFGRSIEINVAKTRN